MVKHRLFSNRGFTVVEVILVVIVIGVLASIITIGYVAYIRNATQSQISTTASAYQFSMKGLAFEADAYPDNAFCIPLDSKCCSSTKDQPTTVYCANDSELGWAPNTSPSSWHERYVDDPPPRMPVFSTFTDCTAGTMSNGPCKETDSIKTGLTFIRNVSGALYTGDSSAKGFLVYYIEPQYTCGTDDVMTFSGGTLSFNSSAKFSRETTTAPAYRECIIGIKPTG